MSCSISLRSHARDFRYYHTKRLILYIFFNDLMYTNNKKGKTAKTWFFLKGIPPKGKEKTIIKKVEAAVQFSHWGHWRDRTSEFDPPNPKKGDGENWSPKLMGAQVYQLNYKEMCGCLVFYRILWNPLPSPFLSISLVSDTQVSEMIHLTEGKSWKGLLPWPAGIRMKKIICKVCR